MKLSQEKRDELIEEYVNRTVDNLSIKDMVRIIGDQIEENLKLAYTDEELISQVREHYPDLLDEES